MTPSCQPTFAPSSAPSTTPIAVQSSTTGPTTEPSQPSSSAQPSLLSGNSNASRSQAAQGLNSAGLIAAIAIGSALCCLLFCFFCVRYYRRNEYLKSYFENDKGKEIAAWMLGSSGAINLMKRDVDNTAIELNDSSSRSLFSVVKNLRIGSQKVESDKISAIDVNPMLSTATTSSPSVTSATAADKKRVTSGEYHMNYMGYETNDLSSAGHILSDVSKIRLDQASRASELVNDPFRTIFPSQHAAVTDSNTI